MESVALAVEGSDLGTTEDPFEPTARCINEHQEETTGDQIWSSKTKVLCVPSPPQVYIKVTCFCSRIFFKKKRFPNKCVMFKLMSLREMPTLQHTRTTQGKSTKICTIPQLLSCSERCNVRSIRDTQLKAGFILITQQMILIVALWLFSHGENGSDPEPCENSGAILKRINLQFVVSEELKAS